MRFRTVAIPALAAFAVMATTQAQAVEISGDSRFQVIASQTPSIEAFPLANGGCEIQIYYEWPRDPSQPIVVNGSRDRLRYEKWRVESLDLVGAPEAGGHTVSVTFDYRDTVGEDGVHRQNYSVFVDLIQVGPFSAGQSFAVTPSTSDPGAATGTLTATLTAADIAAATANGNAGYDHYQAQCG